MAVLTDRKYDFSGYATRVGIECSDGRTIMHGAFKHNDQKKVPLVWQHLHDDPERILGHAILEDREDGTYAYAYFNGTPRGQHSKQMVEHGDITALSIYANRLKQQGDNVLHGDIKEVSLVMAGANMGAFIDNVNLQHSDSEDMLVGEVIIYTGEEFSLEHADEGDNVADTDTDKEETVEEVLESLTPTQRGVVNRLIAQAVDGDTEGGEAAHAESDDSADDDTVQDIYDSLTPVQKNVVHSLLERITNEEEKEDGVAHSDADSNSDETSDDSSDENSDDDSDETPDEDASSDSDTSQDNDADLQHNSKEGSTMARNVFEENGSTKTAESTKTLSHADLQIIANKATRNGGGSYKEAVEEFVLEHADYGIEDIEFLFPEARTLTNTPELIARQAEWVPKVLGATKHSPFARIKSIVADLTAEEARAKGYIKGTEKKDEVVKLLRRTTGPTTVYKKQKLDRDDIIDITDLDVVTWLKWEIRFMLNEEIARAILIGDGRSSLSDDKIKDPEGAIDGIGIRSIANDNDLYAHKVDLAANISSETLIDEVTRARTAYRGSGNPTFYTTDKVLTDLLLLKDKMHRRLYGTDAELASALRVKEIVTVEVLEDTATVLGIMVNLVDYTVGANKGGELTFFEDFDIDFNQNKYLLETRISGALTKPKSAIVIRREQGTLAVAAAPSFNGTTNTITIPTSTGVNYLINDEVVTGDVVITENVYVTAVPAEGHYLEPNSTNTWPYTYTAG